MTDPIPPQTHLDAALFVTAVHLTAKSTGFSPKLIEKDYHCSLVLAALKLPESIVFKGGTALSKIHIGFFRLSEDLDFAVSLPVTAPRSQRRKQADVLRQALQRVPPLFRVATPLTGHNNSSQYNAALAYTSLVDGRTDTISVELSTREPLILEPVRGAARTLLINPVSGAAMVPPFAISTLALQEALAEKFRAALSRRDAAIRDFFDIDHAVRGALIDPFDEAFVQLVRQKLAVPGNHPVRVDSSRRADLQNQTNTRLLTVLRAADMAAFDLDRAFALVAKMAQLVEPG